MGHFFCPTRGLYAQRHSAALCFLEVRALRALPPGRTGVSKGVSGYRGPPRKAESTHLWTCCLPSIGAEEFDIYFRNFSNLIRILDSVSLA